MARKNRNAGAAPLTSPQTREERYLANIAGLVATKPAYPFTRTERYLDAITSATSGLADRVTALETGKLNVIGKGINLLDNAYFIGGGAAGAFPVNQRYPQTKWTTGGVTFDRWNIDGGTLTILSDYISYTAGASGNWLIQFYKDEQVHIHEQNDTVLSLFISTASGNKLVTVPLPHIGATPSHTVQVGVDNIAQVFYSTPADSYGGARLGINVNANSTVSIIAAKLELGSMQTLARKVGNDLVLNDPPPNYQQELSKCQRYLWIPASNMLFFAPCYIDGAYKGNVTFPVTMANAPQTVTATSSTGVFNVGSAPDGFIFDVGANVGYITNLYVSAE